MALRIGKQLSQRGLDVHYVIQNNIQELPHNVPPNRLHILTEYDPNRSRLHYFQKIMLLRKVTKKVKPKAIVAFTRFSSFLATFSGVDNIIGTYDYPPYIVKSKMKHFESDWAISWPWTRKILVPSKGLYRSIRGRSKFHKSKLGYLPNCIDFEDIKESAQQSNKITTAGGETQQGQYIIAIGRLCLAKNFPLLLEAFKESKIRQSHKLLIVGHGVLEKQLEELVHELRLTNYVIFTGKVANPFPLLSRASFLVNTSIEESFCLVILEALALGVPVVATDCDFGPADMVVDNVNGRLVPNRNKKELISVLDEIEANPSLLSKWASKASDSVRSFSSQEVGEQYFRLIQQDME